MVVLFPWMLKNIYYLKCVFFTNVKKTNILNLSLQCARVRDEAPVCGGRMVRSLIIHDINLLMMIDDGDDHDD